MPIKLDSFNAVEYLSSRGLIDRDDVISVESLGWGVSNTLVKVSTHQHCMVIKQSLPRLRVSEEWLADRERIFREWACIRTLCGILPDGTIPQVYHQDTENFLFVMSCAPSEGDNWKEELLAGQVSLSVAGKVGRVLAVIPNRSREGRNGSTPPGPRIFVVEAGGATEPLEVGAGSLAFWSWN